MNIFSQIKSDLKPFKGNRSSFLLTIFILIFNPSFKLIYKIRLQKYFYEKNFKFLKNYFHWRIYKVHNCDISETAVVGQNIRFPHPIGIVIGAGVVIKDNVTIYQNVTLGSHGNKNKPKSYPIIEDNVIIYAGAKILGGIIVGKNAIIGANAVVTRDVPENNIVVATVIKK